MAQSSALAAARELIRQGKTPEAISLLQSHAVQPDCAVRLRELYLGEHDSQRALPLAQRLAVGSGGEAHVSRSILALANRDLESAVEECELAIAAEPELATAYNHLGRALQNAGHSLQAVSALRRAVAVQDDYPEAWYNLALVLRATGALSEAIRAYRKALERAPGYRAADLNLGITLLLTERVEEALFCFESVLRHYPDDIEGLANSGLALHLLGRFSEARERFERALDMDPLYALAWTYLGVLLHECHEPESALAALLRGLELDPQDVEAWVEVASIHEQANRLAQASEALENAQRADPRHPALRLEKARLQRRQGDLPGALDTLLGISAGELPARLAQQYWFELGQALDRNGDYDKAFDAFTRGNRLAAESIRRRDIDPQGFEKHCAELEAWLRAGASGIEAGIEERSGDLGEDLCFLVGFPRSGTTLLDTMLDVHPEIAAIEEWPTLEVVVDALRGRSADYLQALAGLDARQVPELRLLYRQQLSRYLDGREPAVVLDKLPLRFLNAGLINRLFPGARLLFALRHPADVVLSNFMQDYAVNEAFIHFDSLESSAAMYDRTMQLWESLRPRLSLPVLEVRYESLIAAPEAEMTRVCSFLGVEPVAAMFDAAQRMQQRAPVRTTSYQQVAEDIYARAAGRWQHYARHLEPHLPYLQPYIERYGYAE